MDDVIWFFVKMLYQLMIGFLCYSALKPRWRTLDLKWKIILCPLAGYYPVDVFLRCTLFWALFQVKPSLSTITVTALCNSLVDDKTYRGRWARSLCRVLNVFDPGHCANYTGS